MAKDTNSNSKTLADPAYDVLRSESESLRAFFSPRNVALIGATDKPGSVGRTVLWNLISNPFGGAVFPVNPNRKQVLGVRAYPELDAVPEPVDLAVIVTQAQSVPAAGAQRRGGRATSPRDWLSGGA